MDCVLKSFNGDIESNFNGNIESNFYLNPEKVESSGPNHNFRIETVIHRGNCGKQNQPPCLVRKTCGGSHQSPCRVPVRLIYQDFSKMFLLNLEVVIPRGDN